MKVAFRVDASLQIGGGHVMRCLTLAAELRELGADVAFVSREHPGHLCNAIESRGFRVERLPPEPTAPGKSSVAHSEWLGAPVEADAERTIRALDKRGGVRLADR